MERVTVWVVGKDGARNGQFIAPVSHVVAAERAGLVVHRDSGGDWRDWELSADALPVFVMVQGDGVSWSCPLAWLPSLQVAGLVSVSSPGVVLGERAGAAAVEREKALRAAAAEEAEVRAAARRGRRQSAV
jgi:hypothetical protein